MKTCPNLSSKSLLFFTFYSKYSARPSKIHKKKTTYYSSLVQFIFSRQYFTYQYRNFNVGPTKVLDTILVTGISFASGSDWISKSLTVKRAKNTKSVRDKCPTSTILLPRSYKQTPITMRNRHLRDKHAETTMPMTDTWPCQRDCTLPHKATDNSMETSIHKSSTRSHKLLYTLLQYTRWICGHN